jgi:hypothetical protein
MPDSRFGRFLEGAASVGMTVGLFALSIWAATRNAQESAGQTSMIAYFEGDGDTNTEPFSARNAWQIFWQGNLDIAVYDVTGTPVEHHRVSGSNGSAFFPNPGEFFLVIASRSAERWTVCIDSYNSSSAYSTA